MATGANYGVPVQDSGDEFSRFQEQLQRGIANGLISSEVAREHLKAYMTTNHQHQNIAIGGNALGIGIPAPTPPPSGQFEALGRQMSVACFDPTSGSYSTKTIRTPADWMATLGDSAIALKEVMEYLAAQSNLDIWKNKPLEKHIYQSIITAGIRNLMGDK